MVISKISQSRNWVNSSAQGSKQKVTRRHGAKFSTENSRKMTFWNAQTGGERWITFIQTFSDFCLQHFQLPLPVICFKNVHYRRRLFRNNLQNAAQNSNYHKKLQIPVFSSQCSCCNTLCLFHFLSDMRLMSGLMGAIALATQWQMPWLGNFCTVNLTDNVL